MENETIKCSRCGKEFEPYGYGCCDDCLPIVWPEHSADVRRVSGPTTCSQQAEPSERRLAAVIKEPDDHDGRCPVCRRRNSRVRMHKESDGTVLIWHCNTPGCANNETASDCYAGGFMPGDTAVYRGPLCIVGHVIVVAWEPDKWRREGCEGDFRFRNGLVPVFSLQHPSTRFWWVSPSQLTKNNASRSGPASGDAGETIGEQEHAR